MEDEDSRDTGWFGDDFGQKVDLTARIREILRNYPEGTSIFKELVQNADDAGAREVRLVLDTRVHGKSRLPHPSLTQLQGPALLAFNDAQFTDTDFQSIQRIGDSLKKEDSKGTKTGRFGIGFNCTYHLTEVPAFVSGRFVVMFDPQACYLPNVNPSNPGKMIDFLRHRQLVEGYPDQFLPLEAFGCSIVGEGRRRGDGDGAGRQPPRPFDGTLFRFALRTEDQAGKSRLSKQVHTVETMREQLGLFAQEAPSMLLFLKSVERLSIFEWGSEGSTQPQCLFEVSIANSAEDLRRRRNFVSGVFASQGGKLPPNPVKCDYRVDIVSKDHRGSATAKSPSTESWQVCCVLGGGKATQMASTPQYAHMKLIPWGGVAGRLSSERAQEDEKSLSVAGQAYCFLPLPVKTGLPVHLNGFFELSSNRRDIWYGDDMVGDGRMRAEWNRSLLLDLITPCYIRLLQNVAEGLVAESGATTTKAVYDSLWPTLGGSQPWQELLDHFYRTIAGFPLLYSELGGGILVTSQDAVLVPPEARRLEENGDSSGQGPDDSMPSLSSILMEEGLPVISCGTAAEELFIAKKVVNKVATPAFVRQHYRTSHQPGSPSLSDPKVTFPSLRNRVSVLFLLQYCTSDLTGEPSSFRNLHGLPLLPVANGDIRPFQIYTVTDGPIFSELCSMGFGLGACLQAVNRPTTGNQRPSLEDCLAWLLEGQKVAGGSLDAFELGDLVFLCNNPEELRLFRGTSSHLLQPDEMHQHVQVLLRGKKFLQCSNVRRLSEDMLPLVIKYALPPSWREATLVPWEADSATATPSLHWFQELWRYLLHRLHDFNSLQDRFPIVPCHEGVNCRLSSRLPVILLPPSSTGTTTPNPPSVPCPSITPSLLEGIRRIGIMTVHDGLHASGELSCHELASYLRPPTRAGLLAVLKLAQGLNGAPPVFVENLARELSAEAKDALLQLMLREPVIELSKDHIDFLRTLPIFSVHGAAEESRPTKFVAANSKPLFFLDIGPQKFDSFQPLMTPIFVRLRDPLLESPLLKALGVPALSRVDFLIEHVFPRLGELNATVRDQTMLDLVLLDLPNLAQMNPKIVPVLKTLPFLPRAAPGGSSTSMLGRCEDLYDPDVEELTQLVGAEFFPAPQFCMPEVLVLLRQLGLRSTLQFPDVIRIAQSVEECFGRDVAEGLSRARNLFSFLNANGDRFFLPPKPPGSEGDSKAQRKGGKRMTFLSKALSIFDDSSKIAERQRQAQAEEQERLRTDMVNQLLNIRWVPVWSEPPSKQPFLPWNDGVEQGGLRAIARPSKARLQEDQWYCSSLYGILDAEFVSEPVKHIFKWKAPLPPSVVAHQLVQIAATFHRYTQERSSEGPSDKQEVRELRQTVASVIPVIYHMLSSFKEEAQREEIRKVLHNAQWVFVGDSFVQSEQVAFKSQINAAPYLYSVPPDLACFSPLLKSMGVRQSFGCSDFVQVIQTIAVATNVTAPPGGRCEDPVIPLTSSQLELCITLVQMISDEVMMVGDWEVFAPDDKWILARTTDLVYDDAPWLSKAQNRKDVRFVHPKISAGVGEKLGIRSLRRLLMESHADSLDFGLPSEAFGQTESLTRRLRHILELYPEGPSILSELIQNADDAGASTVRVMYNAKRYGSTSLLGQKMAAWQGPALYFYNDASFTPQDFQNIARIGQASKLDKVVSTGRFGLGFNSTYWVTDLPGFVSNDSLVIFDPHIKYLPGATKQQPGIKIKFVETDLLSDFSDQFSPFTFFGCTLKDAFPGTLFRFPLRTDELARESEISKSCYDAGTIRELFLSFQESISRFLLFLRNVGTVEVYINEEEDGEGRGGGLRLLYRASRRLMSDNGRTKWKELGAFMAGTPTNPLSKEAFYARLASTPPSQLPAIKEMMEVTYEGLSNWAGHEQRKVTRVDEFLVLIGMGSGPSRAMAVDPAHRHLKFIPCGGVAAYLTSSQWEGDDERPLPVVVRNINKRGQVFCFLPLPVDSGLPVFVNGYFELSSNRRDIWAGGDLSGEGKRRSQWNAALLADVVAPLYADLIVEITRRYPSLKSFFDLFPVPEAGGGVAANFRVVVIHLYERIKGLPVLHAETSSGLKWTPPKDCVLMSLDEEVTSGQLPEGEAAALSVSQPRLREVLMKRGLYLAQVPSNLKSALRDFGCCRDQVSPPFVRALLREPSPNGQEWPSGFKDVELLLLYCTSDLTDNFSQLEGLPLVPLQNGTFGRFSFINPASKGARPENLFFIAEDSERVLFDNDIGEALVVMSSQWLDGRTVKVLESSVLHQTSNVVKFHFQYLDYFLAEVMPKEWLDADEVMWKLNREPAGTSGVVPPNEAWINAFWSYLANSKTLFPSGRPRGEGSSGAEAATPLAEIAKRCGRWPLLPAVVSSGQTRVLRRLRKEAPPLYFKEGMMQDGDNFRGALASLGVRVVDIRALPAQADRLFEPEASPMGAHGAHSLGLLGSGARGSDPFVRHVTAIGILAAIYQVIGGARGDFTPAMAQRLEERFMEMKPDHRRALRNFFGDQRNLQQLVNELSNARDQYRLGYLLRYLPIYESYQGWGQASSPTAADVPPQFCALTEIHYLSPPSIDPRLLDTGGLTFIRSLNTSDGVLLDRIGVKPLPLSRFYREFFLARLESLPPAVRVNATVSMLLEQTKILAEDPTFIDHLKLVPFVPAGVDDETSAEPWGKLHTARDLYDPLQSELQVLLPRKAFPCREFCNPEMVSKLRALGLRGVLTPDGVIRSAKSIEMLGQQGQGDKAIKRGKELLRFLENHLEQLIDDYKEQAAADIAASDIVLVDANDLDEEGVEQPPRPIERDELADLPPDFIKEIQNTAWVPVKQLPPHPLLPWPTTTPSVPPVLPPVSTRLQEDMWLCSSRMGIIDADVSNPLLKRMLGWIGDIAPFIITQQLLLLTGSLQHGDSRGSNSKAILARVLPDMYDSLQRQVLDDSLVIRPQYSEIARTLSTRPWILVEKGVYESEKVAFSCPRGTMPYLASVPFDLDRNAALFKAFGVRDSFEAKDFVDALTRLYQDTRGKNLSLVDIEIAGVLLKSLSKTPYEERQRLLSSSTIYAPSETGIMYRIEELVYSDAKWLLNTIQNRSNIHFIHKTIRNDVARALGAKSLRDALLGHAHAMQALPCPTAKDIRTALAPLVPPGITDPADLLGQVLVDVMEVAEELGTQTLEVMVDMREHERESLLHPLLSEAQGPALVVFLRDVTLSSEDLVRLLHLRDLSLRPFYGCGRDLLGGDVGRQGEDMRDILGQWPQLGRALCSMFHVSDCLQVLSGETFHIFDPCGRYLLSDPSKEVIVDNNEGGEDNSEPASMTSVRPSLGRPSSPNEAETEEVGDVELSPEDREVASLTTAPQRAVKNPASANLPPQALARRYTLAGENLHNKFPDQFRGFLHFFEEGERRTKGGFKIRGTIIRCSLRVESSPISDLTFNLKEQEEVSSTLCNRLSSFIEPASSSLLFAMSLEVIRAAFWRKDAQVVELFQTNFRDPAKAVGFRKARRELAESRDWRKNKLTQLFSSHSTLPRALCQVEVVRRYRERDTALDRWLVLDTVAMGSSRDIALTEPFKSWRLCPLLSVAARLETRRVEGDQSDTALWAAVPGRVFSGFDTQENFGLPFHIHGPFFMCGNLLSAFIQARRGEIAGNMAGRPPSPGGVDSIKRYIEWNTKMLSAMFDGVFPALIENLRTIAGDDCDQRGFYSFWPYIDRLHPRYRQAVPQCRNLTTWLSKGPYFLLRPPFGNGDFVNANEAYFILHDCRSPVEGFIRLYFRVFDVPASVAQDLRKVGMAVKEVSPAQVRKFIRQNLTNPELQPDVSLALDLLAFCVSDAVPEQDTLSSCKSKWRELYGLPLIPLRDGTVGSVSGGSAMYILANEEQQFLLPQLRNRFVSMEMVNRLGTLMNNPDFLSAMGISAFNPQILAQNIQTILPGEWKGQLRVRVDWDQVPAPFSALWLHTFWSQVPFADATTLFSLWPLVPSTKGELVSCSMAAHVLRLSVKVNTSLQERLEKEAAACQGHRGNRTSRSRTRSILDDVPEETGSNAMSGADEMLGVTFRSICLNMQELFALERVAHARLQPPKEQQEQLLPATAETEPGVNSSATVETVPVAPEALEGREPTPPPQQPQPSPPPAPPAPLLAGRHRNLERMLYTLDVPFLELCFIPEETRESLITTEPREALRMVIDSLFSFQESIRWDQLNSADSDQLLLLLTTSPQGSSLALTPSEADKVKHLPLFELLSGERLSLEEGDYVVLDERAVSDRSILALMPLASSSPSTSSRNNKILKRKTELNDLYRDLGVTTLDKSGVLSRFLIPELPTMTSVNRKQLLDFIRGRWENEFKNDDALSEALRQTPFIELSDGSMVQASSLYDPRSEILKEVFDDDPNSFPPGEFASTDWLKVLTDLGLRSKMDKPTLLSSAQKIERFHELDPLPFPIALKASKLLKLFIDQGDMLDKPFLKQLASIRCVPVEKPGLHTATGASARGPVASRQYIIKSYAECYPPKDRNLVWSVAPVLLPIHTPAQLTWSSLGIKSPPSREHMLRHLAHLTNNTDDSRTGAEEEEGQRGCILDNWTYSEPPMAVFQSIYGFLDEQWNEIAPSVKVALKDLPCIPVGNRLVKASRLYFRLTQDLSPFMFEVPRVFGAYDRLFKEMGTKQSPSIQDYALLLSELQGECGQDPLNPNELEAVIKVVVLLGNLFTSQRGEGGASLQDSMLKRFTLYLPDDRSVLVSLDTCLYDDASWLRGRVHAHLLRVVHPRISLEVCEQYGILRISQVVREVLDRDFQPELVTGEAEHSSSMLSETLNSRELARALACLILQRNVKLLGMEDRNGQGEGSSDKPQGSSSSSYQDVTDYVQRELQEYTVIFTRTLRTRFLRRLPGTGGVRGSLSSLISSSVPEEDITSKPEGSMFFVDRTNRRVLLAVALLPPAVTPAYVLSLAVAQMLSLGADGDQVVGPLAALLATPKDQVQTVMELLRLEAEDERRSEHLRRGVPGQPLLAMDAERVEFRPLRSHLSNEIIAWHGDDEVLRYGVILSPPDQQNDDDSDGGVQETKMAGVGLVRRLTVRTHANKVQEMLTTQVYSFRATRTGKAAPNRTTRQQATAATTTGMKPSGEPQRMARDEGESGQTSSQTMGSGSEATPSGDTSLSTVPSHGPPPVASDHLLDAVDEILSRVNMSLGMEKKEVMAYNLKLQGDLNAAYQDVESARSQVSSLATELDKIKASFQCQICYQRDVDHILPCGHMLCAQCKGSIESRRQCPFCRARFQIITPFFKPFS